MSLLAAFVVSIPQAITRQICPRAGMPSSTLSAGPESCSSFRCNFAPICGGGLVMGEGAAIIWLLWSLGPVVPVTLSEAVAAKTHRILRPGEQQVFKTRVTPWSSPETLNSLLDENELLPL
jgi:hypothetical protein